MSTARPRPGAYVWATWLPPLIAASNSCLWSVWFRAHFLSRRVTSFDDPTWQVEHDALVIATRDGLRTDDFLVTQEDENRFALTNGGITLAGRPDLVAVRPDRILVVDCKSGSPRPAHRFQVMIYMTVLPCVRPELQGKPIEGMIQYQDEEVIIPASAIDGEFRQALRTIIHTVGSPTPPRRVPSAHECSFCPIGQQDCPERVELGELVAISNHGLF